MCKLCYVTKAATYLAGWWGFGLQCIEGCQCTVLDIWRRGGWKSSTRLTEAPLMGWSVKAKCFPMPGQLTTLKKGLSHQPARSLSPSVTWKLCSFGPRLSSCRHELGQSTPWQGLVRLTFLGARIQSLHSHQPRPLLSSPEKLYFLVTSIWQSGERPKSLFSECFSIRR